jgi:hypothetical protein
VEGVRTFMNALKRMFKKNLSRMLLEFVNFLTKAMAQSKIMKNFACSLWFGVCVKQFGLYGKVLLVYIFFKEKEFFTSDDIMECLKIYYERFLQNEISLKFRRTK